MKKKEIFKNGDHVAFIDDVISGKIIKIENNRITIESEEGFLYHCHPEEIILRKDLNPMIDTNEIQKKEESGKPKRSVKKSTETSSVEVDLHIHNLIESTKGMSNFDILSIQLNQARQTLKYAMENNIRSVIFIHGVGEGVLKKELIKMLRRYPVKISEANFHKYGLGATEAYIFQNYKDL